MNYLTGLFIIHLFTVLITDLSDWPKTAKKLLCMALTKGKLTFSEYRFHLLDCSYCLIFHASTIYTIIFYIFFEQINPIFLVMIPLSSFLSTTTADYLILIKDILGKINRALYKNLHLDE